jgi:hypothetical protein
MRTNLAIAICEVGCRGRAFETCALETCALERGEEDNGRAAFCGQERNIYAVSSRPGPGSPDAAPTRPR